MYFEPISGRLLCNSLVGWMSKSNPECWKKFTLVQNQIISSFIVCPLHCSTALCFHLNNFVWHLYIILWPCIASLEKKRKTQSLWYLLHSVGTVDVNVCTLYSTFINTCRVLFWGEKNRGILNRSIIFLCKKREKYLKMDWKG